MTRVLRFVRPSILAAPDHGEVSRQRDGEAVACRPDPALLIRLALLDAFGDGRNDVRVDGTECRHPPADEAIVRGLSELAALGCPTSTLVLEWLSDRKRSHLVGEGGRNA